MDTRSFIANIVIFVCLCLAHLSFYKKYPRDKNSRILLLISGTCFFATYYYLLEFYFLPGKSTGKSLVIELLVSLFTSNLYITLAAVTTVFLSSLKNDVKVLGIIGLTIVFGIAMFIKCNHFELHAEKFNIEEFKSTIELNYTKTFEQIHSNHKYKENKLGLPENDENISESKQSTFWGTVGEVMLTIIGIILDVLS